MQDTHPLFREEARKQYESPEKLDEAVRVISRFERLLLAAGVVVCGALLCWSLFGTIDVRVTGTGMIMFPQGTPAITSLVNGVVETLYITVDQQVKKGDPIAYIYQPELDIQENTMKRYLNDYTQAHERMKELETKNLNETLRSYQSQKDQLNSSIQLANDQIELLLVQEESYHALYEKGIASQQDYDKAQVARMNAQVSLKNQQSQLDSIHKAVHDAQTQYELTIQQRELNMAQQEHQIAEQNNRRTQEGKIYAPSNGIICEVSVSEGQTVSMNSLIALIEEHEPDETATINLEAVVFVNSVSAKKVREGQQALISPTIVRPSQYGSITGSVTSVSYFPLTQTRLASLIPDSVLNQQLLSQGSVFEVRLKLDKHPSSPSGYHWTSGEGPEIQIYSGTLTNAMICVEQRKPISYLIPFLNKYLLGSDSYGVYDR